jgi:histone-lysine N-methyltransferase SETMAR
MTEKIEQRICIKFCQKLGDSCMETFHKLVRVYGDTCMSRASVYDWYKRFQGGRETVESDQRSGRPSTSRNDENVAAVRAKIRENRRLTIREIAKDIQISFGSVQSILTDDLGMRRVSAKFVPRLLSADQKETRVSAACDFLECVEKDRTFIAKIITGDESWVYGYDPETKAQSSQWTCPSSPRPKKARQVRSNVKVMLTVFFDQEGIVHHEYAPQGQTITKEYYVQVLTHLRDAVRRKRPQLHAAGDWLLHHDNAPAHASHLVQQFLAKHQIPQVNQPPYSPDLAPCDFFLFPKVKLTLKGSRFDDVDTIKMNATQQLHSVEKNDFQKCFQQWQERWTKCIVSDGDYFEGD